ncbi:hypothetical protein ACWDR0_06530 [Streptomyces sp. NPDC003691]
MPILTQPAQPPDGINWLLILAMITASPGWPWAWAVLVSAGAALSFWSRR